VEAPTAITDALDRTMNALAVRVIYGLAAPTPAQNLQ
jgi:hypothetical protein